MEFDEDTNSAADDGMQGWAGAEATVATAAAGVGVARGWKPPTSEPGMAQELTGDVPAELSASLSIEEQVGFGHS